MQYNYLIERKDNKTFKEQVKPFLNKDEHYYKVYLYAEDGFSYQMVVGFAYRCNKQQLKQDLVKWADEEVEGWADFDIVEKIIFEDGSTKAIEYERF